MALRENQIKSLQAQRQPNAAGVRGVWCEAKQKKKWRARITVEGKHVNLGSFHTIEEAKTAYEKAVFLYFGVHYTSPPAVLPPEKSEDVQALQAEIYRLRAIIENIKSDLCGTLAKAAEAASATLRNPAEADGTKHA